MNPSRALATALATLLLATPARATAPRDEARAELDAGLAAYDRKDFAAAQQHFERAYDLHASPDTLYAWAQAARNAGDCETAVDLYRRFIDEGATGDQRDAAEQNEARCREVLAQQEPPVEDAEPPPPPVVAPPPDAPPPRTPKRDPAGIALVTTGTIATVGGIVMIAVGEVLRAQQARTRDYARFDTLDGRVDALYAAGGITLGVGVVMAVIGAVRLAKIHRRDRDVAQPAASARSP